MKKIISILLIMILIVPSAYAETASEWAFDGIYAAAELGIIDGVDAFSDYTRPVTREEICAMAVRAYQQITGEAFSVSPEDNPFSDTRSYWAAAAAGLGLIGGREAGIFAGNEEITRQESAKLFTVLAKKLGLAPSGSPVSFSDASSIAPWAREYVAYVSASGYFTADYKGAFLPDSSLTAEQAISVLMRVYAAALPETEVSGAGFGLTAKIVPVQSVPAVVEETAPIAGSGDYVYNGRYKKNDPSAVFTDGEITTKEEADAQMVDITVDIWELRGDEKVSSSMTLTVHKNIAEAVKAVFADIYNGSEKFPIDKASTYCYSFRTTASGSRLSEHATGTAIDINPDQNYCVYSDGSTVGSLYAPGENPYSVQKFGDCWTAFVSHGFTWGGDAWDSPNDYMHFSYLGK